MRRRLLWVFIALGIGASLTWYYRTTVILWLLAPARGALSASGQPIFTGPTEMFNLAVRLTMLGGVLAATPVLVFQAYQLLRPLLSKRARRSVVLFLPAMAVCYLAGAAFAYFVLLPTGLRFLLLFGTDVAMPMIRITEYMDLALAMLFWLGVVFELPLVMLLLAKLRVVSYAKFGKVRRYVPAMAFILSAILTPTFDIVNQTMVAVPLVLLYEAGMLLVWLARPRQTAAHRP